jgi:SAM-dependent methyltransferase
MNIVQRWLRTHGEEILDREGLNLRGRRILSDLDRWNSRIKWYQNHCRMVDAHWEALGCPEPFRILDVGTGPGGLLSALADHYAAKGIQTELMGVDLSEDYVAMAQQRLGDRAQVMHGDATALDMEDARFDVATTTLMMHHLPPPIRAKMVIELGRVCRSVYIFDLEITLYGAVGWALLAPLMRMHRDTLHDGVLSVRRGSTFQEFEQLVSPLPVRVRRVFPTALCTVPC